MFSEKTLSILLPFLFSAIVFAIFFAIGFYITFVLQIFVFLGSFLFIYYYLDEGSLTAYGFVLLCLVFGSLIVGNIFYYISTVSIVLPTIQILR